MRIKNRLKMEIVRKKENRKKKAMKKSETKKKKKEEKDKTNRQGMSAIRKGGTEGYRERTKK